MGSFEFVIPLRREDLLNVGRTGDYSVDEVLGIREISSSIDGCVNGLLDEGPALMLERFDFFYSCLCQFSHLDMEIRVNVWNAMLKAVYSLTSDLSLLLDDQDVVDSEIQSRTLNVLKMNCYIMSQLTILFEDGATKEVTNVVVASGKGRSKVKRKTNYSSAEWDWNEEKQRVVNTIRELMTLPLQKLWSPPVIEEEFLNLFCNCCCKMLENSTINRTKELKESIFHLLGIIVKKNKNTIGIAVKITQMLQQFEHLAVPLAQAMIVFVRDHDIKNVLNEIIREIGTMDAKDLSVDSVGTRSFSSFLVEIAQHMPSLILSNISILVTHLDGELYCMRNCVLGIMGEILLHTMDREELDERTRIVRDQFLDHLEYHLHDVHAFVRSRVLQIWTKLFQEKVVPIARQQQLLELVVGRLEDKSSSVRKYAIVLLTTILKSNPFAAKLSLKELKENLQKEKTKLKEMQPDSEELMDISCGVRERSMGWAVKEDELKVFLERNLTKSKRRTLIDNPPRSELVLDLRSFIDAGEYEKAVSIFFEAQNEIYSNVSEEDEKEEEQDGNKSNDSVKGGDKCLEEVLNSMREIYIGTDDEVRRSSTVRRASGSRHKVRHSNSQRRTSDEVAGSKETGPDASEDVLKQKVIVHYLKDSIKFAEVVSRAIPLVCQLLGSSHTTDVLTSIEFFVLVYEFGVQDVVIGIQRMLTSIWSKEATVKTAVVGAYKRLYLGGSNGNRRHDVIVKNLINLVKRSTFGQLASLEEMICEFVKAGEIEAEVFERVWDIFANRNGQYSTEDSNASVVLLQMAAGANLDIVKDNLQLLVTVGLGERAKNNFKFARDVFVTLLKLSGSAKPSIESVESPMRMPMNHIIFPRLTELLSSGLTNVEDEMWIPMAEQAVNVVYKLAEHPDTICEELFVEIVKQFGNFETDRNVMEMFTEAIRCRPLILTRFIALCGHVALCQMIHLDVNIFCELKRRRCLEEKEAVKKKAQEKRNKNKRQKRQSISANSVLTPKVMDTMEDEDGLTGAVADDVEAEYIRKVCDKELVTGPNLLASIVPVILTIASNPGQYPDSKLQAAASLSLAKYMMVSCDFCDSQLQLLFTILEKSVDSNIRANTIVALGDLSCRFPNLVEPWTSHLYGRLRDESFQVRRSTLVVLTHLILHDMIKVKGQISDLALCVVDKDEHISDLAKIFFQELSQKGNSIYNVLPDIISRLSDEDVGTTEENFQAIMKFLLPFVQKDKLLENMVEKLLHRLSVTRSERQWRDLAFCLPLLCLSEKSYVKLLENLSCFADKLMEPKVYDHFANIVIAAKKNIKPDYKAVIDELDQRIEEFHNKGVDDEAIVCKASQVVDQIGKYKKQNVRGPMKGKKQVPSKSARLKLVDSSDSEEFDENPKLDTKRTKIQLRTMPARKASKLPKNRLLTFSSDSDDDFGNVQPNKKSGSKIREEAEQMESDSDCENFNPNSHNRSKCSSAVTAKRAAKNKSREP